MADLHWKSAFAGSEGVLVPQSRTGMQLALFRTIDEISNDEKLLF